MSRRRQQSENALFIFCLLKNTIQPLGAKDFDFNQGAKLEYVSIDSLGFIVLVSRRLKLQRYLENRYVFGLKS